MFNNPYMRNQQSFYEQIDNEINNLQQMKEKMKNSTPVPTNLTQNFQLAPTNREIMRYVNSIDDVQRENVIGETPYFSKDLSIVWIKSLNGNIRSFELNEIIPKDEKDLKIEYLQAQIEELKKGMKNNECKPIIDEPTTSTNESTQSSTASDVSKLSKKSK